MTGRLRAVTSVLALLALGVGAARGDTDDRALQPYQMVRSLQLVQDRIAGGDHAALPMQKKLLELTDARFRAAGDDDFSDRRNLDALMIYAMSGGNPETVSGSLARVKLDEADRAAAAGILGYLTGDVARAHTAMAAIDPSRHTQEVAAFLFLVAGSVAGPDDPQQGIALFDRARLLGPGTLVEEAALRRTVPLAVTAEDAGKFLSASEQYARRYLRSPYSSQFAEAFISGIVALKETIDLKRVEEAVAWMTREQARVVYLRLARRAAIDGDRPLLEFASSRARNYPPAGTEEEDPRSELYSSISSVTSETVEQVLDRLRALDSRQLSAGDRALLNAAKAVAAEVVAPVDRRADPVVSAPGGTIASEAQTGEAGSQTASDLVVSAREKLEAIDRMLQEAGQ